MTLCVYCNLEVIEERYESGYNYCLADKCQKIGVDILERDFRKEYTPALLHKSNYFWIKKSDLPTLNVRADLLQQRED